MMKHTYIVTIETKENVSDEEMKERIDGAFFQSLDFFNSVVKVEKSPFIRAKE